MKRLVSIFLLSMLFLSSPIYAESPVPTANPALAVPKLVPSPPAVNAKAYILMDARTGNILAEKDPMEKLPIASLTKLMSLYLISSALKEGQIKPNDQVTVSEKAWRMDGSRMFAKVNSQLPLMDLVKGVIIASGNDSTVALAEHLGGTEERFSDMMNQQAKLLKMNNTHYLDSTGLSDEGQYSTAYDLALLARALIHNFPEDYKWYKDKWIEFNKIRQPNRNRLLWHDQSVDGLKTGHTSAAGYCLVASAQRNDMRLISVVLGAPGDNVRINDSGALLNYGFRFFRTYKIYSKNQTILETRVWFGKKKMLGLGVGEDFYITIPTYKDQKDLKVEISLDDPIEAPVVAGKPCGKLTVLLDGKVIDTKPLVAVADNPKANIFSRMIERVKFWFYKKKEPNAPEKAEKK